MRAPYLGQIAQPLAGATPPLRSSRRWPLRTDEARLPAAAPPAYATPIAADRGPTQPPAVQAVREVLDPRAPSANASPKLPRSTEKAPVAPRSAPPTPSPPRHPRPLPPGPKQVEPPQTIAAAVRPPNADAVIVTTPQPAAQRPAVAASTAAPEASVEPRPERTGSEGSERRSVRPPPGAPAVAPPDAPELRTLGTEATSS